jgi:DNA-binding phage protein
MSAQVVRLQTKPTTHRTITQYTSYNFIDKDPIIDYVRTLILVNGGIAAVARSSGVSHATIHNWINGATKRPQFATVAAVLMACGETKISLRAILRRG